MTLLVLIAFVYILFAYQNYLNNKESKAEKSKANNQIAVEVTTDTLENVVEEQNDSISKTSEAEYQSQNKFSDQVEPLPDEISSTNQDETLKEFGLSMQDPNKDFLNNSEAGESIEGGDLGTSDEESSFIGIGLGSNENSDADLIEDEATEIFKSDLEEEETY